MTTQAMPTEVQLALGRIFRLMSRPFEQGDAEQYETARRVILNSAEAQGRVGCDYSHNLARDYHSIVMSGQ